MHLLKGSWEELVAAEKFANAFTIEAGECLKEDPSAATVSLLFAIEARLRILTIVARDTVRPIGTYGKDDDQEEATP